jgi:hypothetical protein
MSTYQRSGVVGCFLWLYPNLGKRIDLSATPPAFWSYLDGMPEILPPR